MANTADMLLTCVLNAGLIIKLRELCPLPYGLFSLQRDRNTVDEISAEHPDALPLFLKYFLSLVAILVTKKLINCIEKL